MRPGWHEPDPEPDGGIPPPAATILVRTGPHPPVLSVGTVLIVGFLLLAVVKPWGDEPAVRSEVASSAGPGPSVSATPSPTPSPALSRADAIAAECRAPFGWRIVTHQHAPGRDLRIWWAISPVAADSAWDPSIPFLSIVSDSILDLGYCAPLFGPNRPASSGAVRVWRVDPANRTAELIAPRRIAPDFPDALVAVYAPPASTGSAASPWPTGRYLFTVDGRWFGVDLRIVTSGPAGADPGGPTAP
jgi:hypothetical protein